MSTRTTANAPVTYTPSGTGTTGVSPGRLIRRPEAGAFLGMVAVFIFFLVFGGAKFLLPAGIASWLNVAANIGIVAIPVVS